MRRAAFVRVLLASFIVVSCGSAPASISPEPTTYALPSMVVPRVCLGIGGGATLAGSPLDPRIAWEEGFGNRGEIIWPPGFSARFKPRLEVIDPSGAVVFREGDRMPGGCAVGPPDNPPSLILIVPGQQ